MTHRLQCIAVSIGFVCFLLLDGTATILRARTARPS